MQPLYPLLENINIIVWLLDVVTLAGFYYINKKWLFAHSSYITMTIIVISSLLMLGYQQILQFYIAANPGFNEVVNLFWYLGFAGFNLLTLIAIRQIHIIENTLIGTLGQYLSFACLILGFIQLAQYAEILWFNSNQHILQLYTIGIPAINITTGVVCFGFALYAIHMKHNHPHGLYGIKKWLL